MESIITLFKAHIEEDHDAGCHTDGKAQYVDNGELPYLQKVPEGGLEIMDKHIGPNESAFF